jgi:hypothetical protein
MRAQRTETGRVSSEECVARRALLLSALRSYDVMIELVL